MKPMTIRRTFGSVMLAAAFLPASACAQEAARPEIAAIPPIDELRFVSPDAGPETDVVTAAFAGQTIHAVVADITLLTEQSRAPGEIVWGRISGRAGDTAMAAYVSAAFDRSGLERVHLPEIELGPQWRPTSAELVLETGVGGPVTLTSAMPGSDSAPAPAGGANYELVWGGLGSEADLAGKDVSGKAVAIRTVLRPATFFATGRNVAARLAEMGALAVIEIVDTPEDGKFLLPGQGRAGIPVFGISNADGAIVEQAFAAGTDVAPRVQARLDVEHTEGLKTSNVIGIVRGKTEEAIFVTAHMDSYFSGANDNASGVAVMLALAEKIATGPQPDKTYVFVGTTGHHVEPLSVGVRQLVANADIVGTPQLVLNVEHVAPIESRLWVGAEMFRAGISDGRHEANTQTPLFVTVFPADNPAFDTMREAIARYQIPVERDVWIGAPGDAIPFVQASVPAIQLIDVGHWYHNTLDVAETVSAVGLERVARAYDWFLMQLDAETSLAAD